MAYRYRNPCPYNVPMMYPPNLVPVFPQPFPPPLPRCESAPRIPVLRSRMGPCIPGLESQMASNIPGLGQPLGHNWDTNGSQTGRKWNEPGSRIPVLLGTQMDLNQISTQEPHSQFVDANNHPPSFPLTKRTFSQTIPPKCYVIPLKKQKVSDTLNTGISNSNISKDPLYTSHHELPTKTKVHPLFYKSANTSREEFKSKGLQQTHPSDACKIKDSSAELRLQETEHSSDANKLKDSSQDNSRQTDNSEPISKCLIPPQKRKALLVHYKNKVLNENKSCVIVQNPKFSHISTMVQYEEVGNSTHIDLDSEPESENGYEKSKIELDSTAGELNLKASCNESQPNAEPEPKADSDIKSKTDCVVTDSQKQQELSVEVLRQSVMLLVRPVFIQLRNELTELYTLYYECVHNLELLQACSKEEMFPSELTIGLPLLAQHKDLTNIERTWEKIQFESSMKFQSALIQHYVVLTDHFRTRIEDKKMAIIKLASDSNTPQDALKEHERVWSESVKTLEILICEKKRIREVKLEGFRQEKLKRQKQAEIQ